MSRTIADWEALPGDTPVLFGRWCTGHRVTSSGPACGSREQTVPATVTNCRGHGHPPCPKCWRGERPW